MKIVVFAVCAIVSGPLFKFEIVKCIIYSISLLYFISQGPWLPTVETKQKGNEAEGCQGNPVCMARHGKGAAEGPPGGCVSEAPGAATLQKSIVSKPLPPARNDLQVSLPPKSRLWRRTLH